MNTQELAFEKLSKLKVGALFMEMGTGKTKVALDLMASKAHKVDYMLWICPCSLKNEIEAERVKWHPELSLEVVGCESIGSSNRIYLEVFRKVEKQRTFIVVDESLKIKNKEAKRTQRILKLGEYAKYKLILNGTPLSKNVLDLWTQMQFLSPKILNMDFETFKNLYCEYYIAGRLKGLVKKHYNMEHLISLIQPYIFDCELSLNVRKHYIDYSYAIDDLQGYEDLKQRYLQNPTDDFMALSQELQSFYCQSGQKNKIIEEIIKKVNDRVIVFVKFLKSIPDNAIAITGEMNSAERVKVIDDFRDGKNKVLYITYGCGAFGLNLQFCKNIIFADHTFDYAQRIQAEARIYRIGQSDDVTYHCLWCDCGLEKMIKASLDKKSSLLSTISGIIMDKNELLEIL